MELLEKIIIDKCNITAEYYLFSLHTYGADYFLTKKFKKQFFKILKNIGEKEPDFIFVNPTETIVIDYLKFGLDINLIMRKRINNMSGIEMNALLHRIAGGTIILCPFYDCWTPNNRAIFIEDHGDQYMSARRTLLIADILL